MSTATLEQLRAARRELRLVKTKAEIVRHRQTLESLNPALDWVRPYEDLMTRLLDARQEFGPAASSRMDRRGGANWPLFRTEQELNVLRQASRILCATNTAAQGVLHGLTSYVIAGGMGCRVVARRGRTVEPELIDAVQQVVDDFRAANQWEGGEQPAFEEEFFQRSSTDGEVFVVATRDDDGRTNMRYVEPEMVTQPPGSDPEWLLGVNAPMDDVQTARGYWVAWDGTAEGEEYTPEEMTHYRINSLRGVKRGLPDWCFDAHSVTHLAGRLRTNMGTSAASQAAIAMVRTHEAATQAQVEDFVAANASYQIRDFLTAAFRNVTQTEAGRVEDIPKGMAYGDPPSAANATNHLTILSELLRAAGRKYNAPEWLTSGDASSNNYASSVTAESPFVRRVQAVQKRLAAVFRRLHELAVKNHCRRWGGVRVGGELASYADLCRLVEIQVTPVSPVVRNRLEEAQANQIEIMAGYQSRQLAAEEAGREWGRIEKDNQEFAAQGGGQMLSAEDDAPALEQWLEVKDDSGHEHDAKGRFGKGGAGGKKADAKKGADAKGDGKKDDGKKPADKKADTKGDAKPTAGGKSAKSGASASRAAPPQKTPSAKAEKAKAAHVMVNKDVQRYSEEHNEPQFAKAMKGVSFPDGEPVDVAIPGADGKVAHGVELKTMTVGGNGKLTMNAYAQVRKKEWEKAQGAAFHTVVIDDRKVYNAGGPGKHDETKRQYFYRRGIAGSARVDTMHKVGSLAEVKKLMAMDDAELPAAAQRKEQPWLTAGKWKPLPGGEKGYKNSETDQVVKPKK